MRRHATGRSRAIRSLVGGHWLTTGFRQACRALLLLALIIGAVPTSQAAPSTANVYIDWGQTQRTITNELYGIGLYGGVAPSIATQLTYKSNLSYFKPGLVRFHYGGLVNSSATDIRGWVDETNRRWDEARIRTVMDAIDSLNSPTYGNYRPAKLVNIPDFPSWMKRVSYTVGGETVELLDPSEYDNYAAFCAQLVTMLKNQGRNVKYYTITNERDDNYYVKWKNVSLADKLDDLIAIYNKAAVAMKAADPSIKVGGLEFQRGDLTDQVRRFVRGAKGNIDFVAYHFYANGNPNESTESVYNRTQDAQRHGLDIVNIVNGEGLNVPVFSSEFNINYNALQEYRQSISDGAVYDALIFTNAIDNGEPATMGWNDRDGYYGKLNNNDGGNDIRMGAHNLQMFNNYMVGDRVTSTSDNGAIVTLATKTGSRKSIAIINRSGSSQTVKLNFAPAWSTASSFNRYVAAPAPAYYYTGSISYADTTNGNFTVEPNSVTVLAVSDSQNVASNSTELARSGWTASASNSNASDQPNGAIDDDANSRWAAGTPQQPGQWFQVDLGTSKTFDKITLELGGSPDDYPRRYEVYASNDPNNLGTPLVTGAGIAVNGGSNGTGGGVRGAATTITFAPQTKRYVRIVQKGSDSYWWWGVSNFRLYNHTSSANLITNPSFQADGGTQTPSGWSTWSSTGTHADADYTETWGSRDGTLHGTHYKKSAYDVYTFQTMTGLANGLYTVRAWVKSGGGQSVARLEVKDYGGSQVNVAIPATDWRQISAADINVTNGQATIGFYSVAGADQYIYFEDVEFFKQ